MERVAVSTTNPINLSQLAAELGTDKLFGPDNDTLVSTTSKTIQAEGVTQAQLEAGLAAHVADPDFGKPAEDQEFSRLRAKAQDVFNGTDTFSAAQIQKIVAGLVLRATR